ncbi:DUF4834 domain-containing protein [Flavobacterium sp. J49]|uniref:DUF4834 domain-containing protein n=1 Tax=Flavobacterium sp. J49 TaxID=2718534 RepID=UPI001593A928|nr:DUF4834 domain-containing protein [Flavobacterium sp. J49]MBF6641023.1 DUF4834 domain-containing protein [Flavobacterium sp. J49]NIC02270.1 DUF4834 domain-containing protein [Flavobacterium sp. J49]
METASMPGFVRTILWIIAIYYIFKFLARLFLPVVAKKVVEKATQQFQQQQQQYQQQQQAQATKTEKPKEKKIVGEYIDFEEIK